MFVDHQLAGGLFADVNSPWRLPLCTCHCPVHLFTFSKSVLARENNQLNQKISTHTHTHTEIYNFPLKIAPGTKCSRRKYPATLTVQSTIRVTGCSETVHNGHLTINLNCQRSIAQIGLIATNNKLAQINWRIVQYKHNSIKCHRVRY